MSENRKTFFRGLVFGILLLTGLAILHDQGAFDWLTSIITRLISNETFWICIGGPLLAMLLLTAVVPVKKY